MKVTFIMHSAFLIESAVCTFIFDYYAGDLPKIDPDKPLYVLASHAHGDHFSEEIFRLFENHPDVTYLLSADIAEHCCLPEEKKIVLLEPEEEYRNLITVKTLRSNDEGVAFLVSFPDSREDPAGAVRTIYHAGDLNNWHWDEEPDSLALIEAYHTALKKIRGSHFDAAFIPLDPRLEDHAKEGILDFAKYADADCIFPMHMWGDYSVIDRFLALPEAGDLREKIVPASFYK